MSSWIIRSERVVLPEGMQPAEIRVEDGRIAMIVPGTSGTVRTPGTPINGTLIDAGSAVVMPGLVDSHVHINDPGRSEWEGFETATRAAAAGGFTRRNDIGTVFEHEPIGLDVAVDGGVERERKNQAHIIAMGGATGPVKRGC